MRTHNIVNLVYNDIRYNSKTRYSVNSDCTKISGSCIFSLAFPCYSIGKHTFWIFVRFASRGDSNKYTKRLIYKKMFKVSVIHSLDGSISSFFIAANSILQQNFW